LNLANGWKKNDVDLDVDAVVRGLKDVSSGATQKLSEEEIRATLTSYNQVISAKREEKRKGAAEKNKKEGEAFLAENKTKPGVISLRADFNTKSPSKEREKFQKPPTQFSVNYRGTLLDGTEFDNSAKRGGRRRLPSEV